MKSIILNLSKISFAVLILMFLLSGCSTNPVLPIINTFNANPTTIDFGNSTTLSWEVSGADTVSIDQGIGIVTASGTIDITPSTATTYTLTATGNSSAITTAEVEVTVINIPLTLQPDLQEGKDAVVQNTMPGNNFGEDNFSIVGNASSTMILFYLQFDLSSIPEEAVITEANLSLYQNNYWGSQDFAIGLYRVYEPWEESTITWDNRPTVSPQISPTQTVSPGYTGWVTWEGLAELVEGWMREDFYNYGILLQDTDEITADSTAYFCTSENINIPSCSPKLEIKYNLP